MNNKYTLKVYPAGRGRDVYRVIELSGNETLKTLCNTILTAFDFTNDHLYEFCMDNKMYSRNSYQSDLKSGQRSVKVKIDELGLVKGQKFSLHYDFGDDWMFTINVQQITAVSDSIKPHIVKEKGMVEQYPDYEEWE